MKTMFYDLTAPGAEGLYNDISGFGFVTEENRRENEMLRIPELNSGFIPLFWYADGDISRVVRDKRGCTLDKSLYPAAARGRLIPLCFKADVDGVGNYRVTVEIDNTDGDNMETLIYITRRRLYFKGVIAAGEKFSRSYDVNVCDFIPRGKKEVYPGKSVDIAVISEHPRLTSVKIEYIDIPTVWIAGDSTLTDQIADYPYHPSAAYSGWGQMLSAFFLPGIAVSNHAHSGLTTHTFAAGGHYTIVKEHIKAGDYFLLQFAHNDQNLDFLRADGGYRERIINYCADVKNAGAYPVIVTPLARNSWRGGINGNMEYNDLLCDYDAECKKIGAELGIPVIGLHDYFLNIIKTHGLESAKRFYYPGDFTHTNDPGALLAATYIAAECKKLTGAGYEYLASHVGDTDIKWDALEGITPSAPPDNFVIKANAEREASVKTDNMRPPKTLTRAEAADMLIKAAHFFICNVYNDMYTDIIGHEWYAGAVQCAYQNGIIPRELTPDGKYMPDSDITLLDFTVMAVSAYTSRRKLRRYDADIPRDGVPAWALAYVNAAMEIGIIKSGDDLTAAVREDTANEICRIMAL